MGASKFYFSDRNGQELNHKLNGCDAGGTGAGIAENGGHMDKQRGNDFKMWRDRNGRIARTEIDEQTWCDVKRYGSNKITIADFPGHTAVLVKFWAPNPNCIEYFWLIGCDGCTKIAEQTARKGLTG